jgi:hypothetical protein
MEVEELLYLAWRNASVSALSIGWRWRSYLILRQMHCVTEEEVMIGLLGGQRVENRKFLLR